MVEAPAIRSHEIGQAILLIGILALSPCVFTTRVAVIIGVPGNDNARSWPQLRADANQHSQSVRHFRP